jgi:chromosomal replication initiator protein
MFYCLTYQCDLPSKEVKPSNDGIILNLLKVIEVGSAYFNLPAWKITGKRGKQHISDARHMIISYIVKNSTLSLRGIGELFGDRDHSSVIHSRDTVKDLCDTDTEFKKRYNDFEKYMSILKL